VEEGEEISRAGGGGGAAQWFGFRNSGHGRRKVRRWISLSTFPTAHGLLSSKAHREQLTGGRSTQATHGPPAEYLAHLVSSCVFFFPFS
jgi:hypothetical protein